MRASSVSVARTHVVSSLGHCGMGPSGRVRAPYRSCPVLPLTRGVTLSALSSSSPNRSCEQDGVRRDPRRAFRDSLARKLPVGLVRPEYLYTAQQTLPHRLIRVHPGKLMKPGGRCVPIRAPPPWIHASVTVQGEKSGLGASPGVQGHVRCSSGCVDRLGDEKFLAVVQLPPRSVPVLAAGSPSGPPNSLGMFASAL